MSEEGFRCNIGGCRQKAEWEVWKWTDFPIVKGGGVWSRRETSEYFPRPMRGCETCKSTLIEMNKDKCVIDTTKPIIE